MGQMQRRDVVSGTGLNSATTAKKAVIVPNDVFISKAGLGNSSNRNESRSEYKAGRKRIVYGFDGNYFNNLIQGLTEMEAIKLISWVATFLGWPVAAFAIFLNIGTFKGNILFVVALLFMMAKLVFFVVKQYQEYRLRQFRIKEREHELTEKNIEDETEK
jgi:hypothetical protein